MLEEKLCRETLSFYNPLNQIGLATPFFDQDLIIVQIRSEPHGVRLVAHYSLAELDARSSLASLHFSLGMLSHILWINLGRFIGHFFITGVPVVAPPLVR